MKVGGEYDSHTGSVMKQGSLDGEQVPRGVPPFRKVTVQLSQKISERLEAVTGRPGVGKSMVLEAALERFLDPPPPPPIEGLIHEHFDRTNIQLERLQSEIRTIAETVALHARYHLTITPPMPQSQQHEACALGRDRFNELAKQVERRVRSGRSLMQETIDRLAERRTSELESDDIFPVTSQEQSANTASRSDSTVDQDQPIAAVREDGSNPYFRHLPNAFC